ncbi:MAG: aminotransferase class I/II-fold pyridoxal phosphate-dependent enzyme [Actinomycetota bacterium]
MHFSPGIRDIEPYQFEELDRRKREAIDAGRELIDFGVGDPRDETPAFIRQALKDAIVATSSYPRAAGLPELRQAIVEWIARRFAVALDPASDLIPTLGSKEPIFTLAQATVDPAAGRDLVVVTAPGYTIGERGACYAGAKVLRLPLLAPDFLPDLDGVDAATWGRTAILWLNYPNNPTGAVVGLEFLEQAAGLARRHDFLLALDEAYSEIWFDGGPPASGLQLRDLTNVVVMNTLSKRSNMTGYRSGFLAGDPSLVSVMKALRPSVGVTPQEFVQRASIAAWGDEAHVQQQRERYADKRAIFLELLRGKGIEVAASVAGMYLWIRVPGGRSSVAWGLELLDLGLVLAPGSYFGPEGEGYLRMAMVPTIEDCRRAADILARLLPDPVVTI